MALRVLVVFGGPSSEHEVSRMSAQGVGASLAQAGCDVVYAEVDRDGRWRSGGEYLDPFGAGRPGVDVVFPLIHGPFGEDGSLQGLLEWCGVPYVGSDVVGSAVAIDKAVMKTVLSAAGLPAVRWCLVHRHELADGREVLERCEALGDYPRFVKPARLGSSVAVSKVRSDAELLAALASAARYDERVLVEEGVRARELECAILGGRPPRASAVGEIRHRREFYDYTAKYDAGAGTRLDIPARVEEGVAAQVRALAVAAFEACAARDLARVDFFLTDDGRLLVNEINTLPGFTPYSMYPLLWQASGMSPAELALALVQAAAARGPRPRREADAGEGGTSARPEAAR
ncbi:MAG: D-alanine--D-alanine ligase [Firmicutes bacterium]|nr:D-alanine--D-alanine ligase [Bacillota bacterium]